MEALHVIGEEHQSLAAIIHAIRFMLREVAAGRLQPDLKLFQAMVHYLDAYAEQRHHPKEDILFRALAERSQAAEAAALTQLFQQHAAAPQRIALLQQAVSDYAADPERFQNLVDAFENYANFYRTHMLLEEEVVLPLLRRCLTATDWLTVNAEFRAEMSAHAMGDGRKDDFRTFYSRLIECAPAPLGFGPRPWQD